MLRNNDIGQNVRRAFAPNPSPFENKFRSYTFMNQISLSSGSDLARHVGQRANCAKRGQTGNIYLLKNVC